MSDDATPSNSLTDKACSATVLAIDTAVAHRICLAVAQVLAAGYGRVDITITHHQVQVIQTTFTDKLNV